MRALYFVEVRQTPDFSAPSIDPGFHDYWARALATSDWRPPRGNTDPAICRHPYLRPPGYPYFLAGIYRIAGMSYEGPRIVQMAVGLLNVLLAYLLARRVFGPGAGLLAALGMSGYWILLFYEAQLQEPVLLIALLLGAAYVLVRPATRCDCRPARRAGLLLGLAALTKPNALLLAAFAAGWLIWTEPTGRRWTRGLRQALALVLGTAVALIPSAVRNYRASGELVAISANGGVNLFIGNNPDATGLFSRHLYGIGDFDTCYDYEGLVATLAAQEKRPLGYAEASGVLGRRALQYMLDNPWRTLRLTIRRVGLFFGPYVISHNKIPSYEREASPVLRRIPGDFGTVFGLALVGAVVAWADSRARHPATDLAPMTATMPDPAGVRLLAGFVLVFAGSYLPFFATALYRVPIIPFLLMFAAYVLVRIAGLFRTPQRANGAALALAAIGVVVLAHTSLVPWNPPPRERWHYWRGNAWERRGEFERAAGEYRQALQINPAHHGSRQRFDELAAAQKAHRVPTPLE